MTAGDALSPRRILLNALPVGGGGNRTVARALANELAAARPAWRVAVLLTRGRPLHDEIAADVTRVCEVVWAPPETARRVARRRWERRALPGICRDMAAVVQINGMVVPGLPCPIFSHFGDPWPYLPEAWGKWYDPALALARRRAQRRALLSAEGVGYTSAWFRDLLADRHGLPARGVVLHNGVPRAWIDAAGDAPPLNERGPRLVSVSNVSPYKRQADVIRALPAVVRQTGLTDLCYEVAGHADADYAAELRRLAAALGVAERVTLHGRVSDGAARDLLRTSRAFVLPSLCESFGIGAVEAMAHGCPVVAARAAAVPEVCGAAADLVPPGDVPALADALARVLTDDAHAADLRRRGVENVRRFDWSATAEKLAAALEAIFR